MSSSPRAGAKNRINNDPADELRRRARRRLVGAVVLFLLALVVVPALIQPGPDTAPDPIELLIPQPNPAASKAPKANADADNNAELAPGPLAEKATAEKLSIEKPGVEKSNTEKSNTEKPGAEKPSLEAKPLRSEPPADKTPEKKPSPEKPAAQKPSDTKPNDVKPSNTKPNDTKATAPKPGTSKPAMGPDPSDPIGSFADEAMGQKNLAKAQARASAETTPEPTTKHWVQVAAVADNDRARALRDQLANKGFAARVEATQSAGNTVYRVRVGPFASTSKADETKASLAKLGFQGRVVQ